VRLSEAKLREISAKMHPSDSDPIVESLDYIRSWLPAVMADLREARAALTQIHFDPSDAREVAREVLTVKP
jgi:hypothetical protein